MGRVLQSAALACLVLAAVIAGPKPADANATTAPPLAAIEYYHAGFDHYFVTASAVEINALNAGQFAGWIPTGFSFPVLAPESTADGSAAVCRFYGSPDFGLDSHFYTASSAECADVVKRFPGEWLLESTNVFRVYPADTATGACPDGTTSIRRLWNQRPDANHRYTDRDSVAAEMQLKGYVAEGYGSAGLPTAFCVPPTAEGIACSITPSNPTPVIGTPLTLVANCTGSPASYQWIGCEGAGNTCTATSTTPGAKAYVVSATYGSTTSPAAVASVIWQSTAPNPNQTPVQCALIATSTNPEINTNVTLTASCTGSPTTYLWSGCSTTTNTCVVRSSISGAVTYSVSASNSSSTSPTTSIILNWKQLGAAIACSLVTSNANPAINTSVTLTASCTGNPTAFGWIGCSSTSATCVTTSSVPGSLSYAIVARNATVSSIPAAVAVNWQVASARPACTVATSNAAPGVNTTITLTASCTNSPTSYAWSGCTGTARTCTTTSAVAGPRNYSVTAANSAGAGAPASVTVAWKSAATPPTTGSAVSCVLTSSNAAPVVNTPVTLTSSCSGSPTSYTWTGCSSTGNTCNAISATTGVATYSVVARNATSTSSPASTTVSWQPVPTPGAGMPTSADFLAKANDPRGGSNGYNTFKRLPNGKGVTFGGYSHNRSGNNAVAVYDPMANSWQVVVPHTPWIDTIDVSGRSFLGNRDNHNTMVVGPRNEFWVMTGHRGGDLIGNYRGVLNTQTWRWQINDTATDFLPITADEPPSWINSAAGWIDALGVGYIFGGATKDNPYDGLARIEPNPVGPAPYRIVKWADPWNKPSFPGAEKLRYISNSQFVRNGKVYVYGGGHEGRNNVRVMGRTLYEIDVMAPSMRVVSVNSLPNGQRVEGEAILADRDPARDLLVATDGIRVNVYDFATNAWANIPVNTASDPDRQSPSVDGAGTQAFWSPEVRQLVILGLHAKTYGLRLNYSGSPPPPAPPPTAPPPPTVPPAPPPTAGTLKVSATAVPYVGQAQVFGSSKHLDFARIGNRWYKMAGDHAKIDPTSPDTQSGRQEILSFNATANDWRVDQMHYIWDPAQTQVALPDDAFTIVRNSEAFVFVSARTAPIIQPPGAAQQLNKVMAWMPGRGWRIVRENVSEITGNHAWRGIYDPVKDRFLIPAYMGNLIWVIIGGDGSDQTARSVAGAPVTYGSQNFSVAGIVADLPNRVAYVYDHLKAELWSVNLDTLALRKLANIPEAAASGQAALKLAWHPDLRAVVLAHTKLHAYEVDSAKLTTWARPDGFVNGVGNRVPTSTLFFDPDTRDIVSIGTIDWDTVMNPGTYWRLKITP